jgi:hypothetical protein
MEQRTELTTQDGEFPAEWKDAFARERLDIPLPADPRPERLPGRVLAAFVLTGLVFLALPGTLLGVLNLLSISGHQSATAAHTAWIQAHGQARTLTLTQAAQADKAHLEKTLSQLKDFFARHQPRRPSTASSQ